MISSIFYKIMVGDVGLEPTRRKTLAPKASASTNSANPPLKKMVGMDSADLSTFPLSGERSTAELHSYILYWS